MSNIMLNRLNHDVLPDEEMRRLVVRAQEGDAEAANQVALLNYRLAYRVARRWNASAYGDQLEELVQSAMVGLAIAIRKYDVSRGVAFSTYAVWWMRQALDRHMDNNGEAVTMGPNALNLRNSLMRLHRKMVQERNEPVDFDALIAEYRRLHPTNRFTDERARKVLEAQWFATSLVEEKSNTDNTKRMVLELITEPGQHERDVLRDDVLSLEAGLARLPSTHRWIVRRLYGLDGSPRATLKELSAVLGTSSQAVAYKHHSALRVLRKFMEST